MHVTIVGAGHYGRGLVARKYAENMRARLLGSISPTIPRSALKGSPLADLPLHRSASAWAQANGPPSPDDLFDLCVHPIVLPGIVSDLASIGARNMVLPKPVARTREDLEALRTLLLDRGIRVAVASQWHYSEVTRVAAAAIGRVRNSTGIERIAMDFSQPFTDEQLWRYDPGTALLPHMIQILLSTGLAAECGGRVDARKDVTRWEISLLGATGRPLVDLATDLRAPERRRVMEVFSPNAGAPAVAVDFLGDFQEGRSVRHPSITEAGASGEMEEDNLGVMVDRILAGMIGEADLLDLEAYRPAAELQIRIEEA